MNVSLITMTLVEVRDGSGNSAFFPKEDVASLIAKLERIQVGRP